MHYHKVWPLLLIAAASIGCGSKPIDYEARFDDDVETTWTSNWNWVDANQHFAKGGVYVDTGDPDDPALDRSHVVPILKRLQNKFGLEWRAVVDKTDPTLAVAVVARLPDDSSIRKKVEEVLDEEQTNFPGAILQQWGHKWLSLDFLNEDQAKTLDKD